MPNYFIQEAREDSITIFVDMYPHASKEAKERADKLYRASAFTATIYIGGKVIIQEDNYIFSAIDATQFEVSGVSFNVWAKEVERIMDEPYISKK